MPDIEWSSGTWTHAPSQVRLTDEGLEIHATKGSDAWRLTSYGFIHDSEHALLTRLPVGAAMEVEFTASFSQQFDQAGVFVSVSPQRWVKSGVEFADGCPRVGAVVTDGWSDWSLAAVPHWAQRRVVVRVSRASDSLTLRAGLSGEALDLIRVAPFPGELAASAGPYVCAPTRAGLAVVVHAWRLTVSDESLH